MIQRLLWYKFPLVLGATLGMTANAVALDTIPEVATNPTLEVGQEILEFEPNPLVAQNVDTETGSTPVTGVSELSNQDISNSMSQVNSVTQFRDVQPTDWAYEALRGLVERYGCIAGYPNGTYRGNRALTRYEFAAGLYSCLLQIERLITDRVGTADDGISDNDLAVLERLVSEFEAELATLGTRVDNLEARLGEVEENQFSTTTRLAGEVIFGLADAFGDDVDDVNTVFHNRVRLNFLTSFTGKDLLQTRLQSGNVPLLIAGELGTQEGRFTYDGPTGNDVGIDILRYIFPVGENIQVQLLANNALHHYYVDTVNPYFEGRAGGENAISRFAERNPIYRIGPFGAGGAIAFTPTNNLRLDLGYISSEAEDPSNDAGVFNVEGSYSAIGQLTLGSRYKIGLTYVKAYTDGVAADFPTRFVLGGTGTALANLSPAALAAVPGVGAVNGNFGVESDSYGVQTSLGFSDNFVLNGWVGLTEADLVNIQPGTQGEATIWNFALGAAFPNFGGEGNILGIIGGAAPTLRDLEVGGTDIDLPNDDFAYHLEAFYKYRFNDFISVTPGVIWLPAVNQDADNDDVFIGTIRTTFRF
jgi:hypothetical protein